MTDRVIMAWGEIPVTQLENSVAFYNSVFGYTMTIDTSGSNPMAVLGGAMKTGGAHLYPGKPAADGGNTIHLAVPDQLEAAMKRCKDAGGAITSPPIAIPDGRFVYASDPDGNSIGLFEASR